MNEELVKLQYINRKTKMDPSTGCWDWVGPFEGDGYGQAQILGKQYRAHRLAYTILAGDIPKGLTLDHLCRNRRCCNPKHLEPVTNYENLRRGNSFETARRINSVKTHCPQGHPYSGDNLHVYEGAGRRSRHCKACIRARWQRRKLEGKRDCVPETAA